MKSNSDWSGFITKVAPESEKVFKCRRIDLRAEGRFLHNFFSGVKFDQCSFGEKIQDGPGHSASTRFFARRKYVTVFFPRAAGTYLALVPSRGEIWDLAFPKNRYARVSSEIKVHTRFLHGVTMST